MERNGGGRLDIRARLRGSGRLSHRTLPGCHLVIVVQDSADPETVVNVGAVSTKQIQKEVLAALLLLVAIDCHGNGPDSLTRGKVELPGRSHIVIVRAPGCIALGGVA